jgi:hypothetical protein
MSGITLHVLPSVPPMNGKAFREAFGAYAVAIDGFVAEGPWFNDVLPAQNFNHHEGVERLETRATCAQVLVAIRQGFFQRFRMHNTPYANVYVNDCDEDVCASWFLLSHASFSKTVLNPRLNRLIHLVDMLDTTAGAYPFPEDLPSLRELAWVMEPYRRFRLAGGLDKRSESDFRGVITDVCGRMTANVMGEGQAVELDTRYEVLAAEEGWTHVQETGQQARVGMFANGIRAFVASTPRADGRWSHVVGRMSTYIRFPVGEICSAMNVAEGLTASDNRWGCATTIGGSPRIRGSALDPKQVREIVKDVLGRRAL